MEITGLDSRVVELMNSVFAREDQIQEVLLFGSRAKGNYRRGSDIDLALRGVIDFRTTAHIAGELDELPLPYKFDVLSYELLKHQPLREHIDRVGISIYRRAPQP